MRLLRLTTENNKGVFTSNFSQDIELEENSQLALQSASFKVVINLLDVIASNNEIKFQITNAITLTIQCQHKEYNSGNVDELFSDIQNRLNGALLLSGKMIGLHFVCNHNKDSGKAQIGYKTSPMISLADAITDPTIGEKTDVMRVTGAGVSTIIDSQAAHDTSLNDNALFHSNIPLGEGCSVFRVKLHKMTEVSSGTGFNGFTMALTKTPETLSNPMTADDKQYLIQLTNPSAEYRFATPTTVEQASGLLPHKYGTAGQGTAGGVENDQIEIAIVGGNIRGAVYQSSSANPTILFEEPYVHGTDYYTVLSIHGGLSATRLWKVRMNLDPHKITPQQHITLRTSHDSNLSTPLENAVFSTPPDPPKNPDLESINKLTLSADFAGFLGYNSLENELKAGQKCDFVANTLFNPTLNNISFYVLIDSLDLESYDSKLGTRKSILGVIPKADNDLVVEYESNNLNFINIKNIKRNIRNIRARIMTIDDASPNLSGLSSLVLLIK